MQTFTDPTEFNRYVGTKPHRSKGRSAGVATSGVALQGPAGDARQEARKKSGHNRCGPQVAVCKDKESSVQETCAKEVVCKHYLPDT